MSRPHSNNKQFFTYIPLAFCTKFCNAKEVKKLLFLSAIIFFQILGIFTLYSSNLISPISAQECRAPGAECGTSGDDKNQCCSIVKAEDVIPGYKAGDPLKCGKEPGSDKNTCIVNKTLGEGDACEGDQANDGGEPIGIGDATVGGQVPGGTDGKEDSTSLCGGDLICNKDTKKCEANRKCIKPGQNESVKCEHDTSSNQKNEADKTCCGGFKCQEGKCVADASTARKFSKAREQYSSNGTLMASMVREDQNATTGKLINTARKKMKKQKEMQQPKMFCLPMRNAAQASDVLMAYAEKRLLV